MIFFLPILYSKTTRHSKFWQRITIYNFQGIQIFSFTYSANQTCEYIICILYFIINSTNQTCFPLSATHKPLQDKVMLDTEKIIVNDSIFEPLNFDGSNRIKPSWEVSIFFWWLEWDGAAINHNCFIESW